MTVIREDRIAAILQEVFYSVKLGEQVHVVALVYYLLPKEKFEKFLTEISKCRSGGE